MSGKHNLEEEYKAKPTSEEDDKLMAERLRNIGSKKPKVAAAGLARGTTENLAFWVIDVHYMGKPQWARITGIVLGVNGKPNSESFHVPYSPKIPAVEKALLTQYPPDQEMADRGPFELKKNTCITIVNFDNQTIPFPTNCLVVVSGLTYEVNFARAQKEDKYADPNGAKEGDCYLEFKCTGISFPPFKARYTDKLEMFASIPLDRVERLKGGNRQPYVDPVRVSVQIPGTVQKPEPTYKSNLVLPWYLSKEFLFDKIDEKPIVFAHLYNPAHYDVYMFNSQNVPFPAKYSDTSSLTYFCSVPITDPQFLKQPNPKDPVQDKLCVSGPDDDTNQGQFRLYSVNLKRPQIDLFGNIRDQYNKTDGDYSGGIIGELGVCTLAIWSRVGAQIIRGMDAILSLVVEPMKSRCTSTDGSFYLKGWAFNIVEVNYQSTFMWAGLQVDFRMASDILRTNKQPKEESIVQKRYFQDPNAVKCICLNEFKGDLGCFETGGWDFYCVPPSDELPDYVDDIGLYLFTQNFFQMNMLGEGGAHVKTNWMINDNIMRKLTIFAIQRD
jgi:hypothetical protein